MDSVGDVSLVANKISGVGVAVVDSAFVHGFGSHAVNHAHKIGQKFK